jgi:hypothetical protein
MRSLDCDVIRLNSMAEDRALLACLQGDNLGRPSHGEAVSLFRQLTSGAAPDAKVRAVGTQNLRVCSNAALEVLSRQRKRMTSFGSLGVMRACRRHVLVWLSMCISAACSTCV